MTKTFGIDIDGTVTCPTTFVPFLNEAFGKQLTLNDISQYELPPLLGVDQETFAKWMSENEGRIYAQAKIAGQAYQVLHSWCNRHRLVYISARPAVHKDLTCTWFDQHGLPYHHIELLGTADKIEQAKKHGVHLFFEDRLDTANDIAEALDIPVVLFDTPYNRGTEHKNIMRVPGWDNAKEKVEALFKVYTLE